MRRPQGHARGVRSDIQTRAEPFDEQSIAEYVYEGLQIKTVSDPA
jgi:hypothetical protein